MTLTKNYQLVEEAPEDHRITSTRIKIRIPKDYQQEPIISKLISKYNLTVNVNGALLGSNGQNDGWFDLDLKGTKEQLRSALIYIDELDVEIWSQTNPEEDGW